MAMDAMHEMHEFSCVIHGGATGADSLASEWAEAGGVVVEVYPADWRSHGRAAGPIRNQEMLEKAGPAFLVAFPGGRGTADMIRRAKKARIPVAEIYP